MVISASDIAAAEKLRFEREESQQKEGKSILIVAWSQSQAQQVREANGLPPYATEELFVATPASALTGRGFDLIILMPWFASDSDYQEKRDEAFYRERVLTRRRGTGTKVINLGVPWA